MGSAEDASAAGARHLILAIMNGGFALSIPYVPIG